MNSTSAELRRPLLALEEPEVRRGRRHALHRLYWAHISHPGALIGSGVGPRRAHLQFLTNTTGGGNAPGPAAPHGRSGWRRALGWKRSGAGEPDPDGPRAGPGGGERRWARRG